MLFAPRSGMGGTGAAAAWFSSVPSVSFVMLAGHSAQVGFL